VRVLKPDKSRLNSKIVTLYLRKPVYAAAVLWKEKLELK